MVIELDDEFIRYAARVTVFALITFSFVGVMLYDLGKSAFQKLLDRIARRVKLRRASHISVTRHEK